MEVVRCTRCDQVVAAHVTIAPGLALPFSSEAALTQAQSRMERHLRQCPGRRPAVPARRARPDAAEEKAVVIGASMAGLLAARVLSDRFAQVTVLDRDRWSDEQGERGGVPQAGHAHGLLARGREIIDELFPGAVAELVESGAIRSDIQRDFRWSFEGGVLQQRRSGMEGLLVSRPLLEHVVRRHVEALPNVAIERGRHVTDLVSDHAGHVAGVVLTTGTDTERVLADLVVDASGRTSGLPEQLERLGFPRPQESRVRVDVVYATRSFIRSPGDLDGDLGMAIGASAATQAGGALLAQEHDRWILSMGAYHGTRPPLELEAYREYVSSLSPAVGDVVRHAEPLDEGAYFRYPSSVRRHFERMHRFPKGLLVIGDAMCTFNPVFGQGMTVAAMEALALRDCLAAGRDGLAQRFFAACEPIIDSPWQIAVANDLAMAGAEGSNPLAARLTNRYVARFRKAAHDDADLAQAFLEVANLVAPPRSLLAPRYLVRVLGRRHPAVPRRSRTGAPVPT